MVGFKPHMISISARAIGVGQVFVDVVLALDMLEQLSPL